MFVPSSGSDQHSVSSGLFQLDRIGNLERLELMHHFQLLLFVLSLVIPFGIFETAGASSKLDSAQLFQTCAEKADFAEVADAEQPELYLTDLSVIDCSAQFKGSLVAVRGTSLLMSDVDAQGCRPPPAVRIG